MIVTKQPENLTAAFGLSDLLDTNGRTIVTANWRREVGGGREGGREREREGGGGGGGRDTDREGEGREGIERERQQYMV